MTLPMRNGRVIERSEFLRASTLLCVLFLLRHGVLCSSSYILSDFSLKIDEQTEFCMGIDSLYLWNQRKHDRHIGPVLLQSKGYFLSRISYYPNTTACFQQRKLIISGDVSLNPGPNKAEKCDTCERTLARNHRKVTCKECNLHSHIKCAGISPKEYKAISNDIEQKWLCTKCILSVLPQVDVDDLESSFNSDYNDQENTDLVEPEIFKLRKTEHKQLLIMHLNINSIQNKFDELKMLNEQLKSQVIFISETKIDSTYSDDQFKLQGYNMYRKDRKKGGGGLMAFISSVIVSKKVKLANNFRYIEVLAIEARINNKYILFIGAYRPPKKNGNDYLVKLEDELNSLCMWAELQKQTIVLMGDLNLNRLSNGREGKILRDLEDIYGLECVIKEPTRITKNSSTLIDVILTNKPELFKKCGVYNPEISDHYLIYGLFEEKVSHFRSKITSFRSTKYLDIDAFNKDLDTAPWHVADIFTEIDDKYNYWKLLFKDVVDSHMPIKTMRFKDKDVPYMTEQWRSAIKKKRKYAKQYARNKTEENWKLKTKYRNIATTERRRAIKKYWEERSNELKTDPGKFYNTFKPFLGKSKKSTGDLRINITVNDKLETDQSIVADKMAEYFSTIADTVSRQQNRGGTMDTSQSINVIRKEYEEKQVFNISPLHTKEVQKALQEINVKKATGWDGIQPKLLKLAAPGISRSLAVLYNCCISAGEWPLEWKKGEWTPVFKDNDHTDINNYRPITILNAVNKTFEKLVAKQITDHYDNKLSPYITAYRKRSGCETSLMKLIEDWRSELDKKKKVALCVTDMSKAFDSLDHSILTKKISCYGFSENSTKLVRSYLTNRNNRVRIGPVVSEWKQTDRGCPQGSSFGPLLWNVYQNDLAYLLKDIKFLMYADDHQLYTTGDDVNCINQDLNEAIDIAMRWYKNNALLGNKEKFKIMTLPRRIDEVRTNINGKEILPSDELKLLGLNIDNELTFSSHIQLVCIKVSRKIGVLARLKNLIPMNAKLHIYKATILPNLTYCHTIWHFCRKSDERKLEKIQERALRIIFNSKTLTYDEMLKKSKLTTLYNRRLQDIAIIMFKHHKGLLPMYLEEIFTTKTVKYNLRMESNIPRYNTVTYGKHSIRYFGPLLWSKLPKDIRNTETLAAFKYKIRKAQLTELVDNSNCQSCPLCNT